MNMHNFLRQDRNKTVQQRVFDLVSTSNVHDVIDLLLGDLIWEPNDKILREEVEDFLNKVFNGRYLVRCSELENTAEMIDNNLLGIRFVGIDEDFVIQMQVAPKQLTLNLDLFLTTHIHSIK